MSETIRSSVICQWRQEYFHLWREAPEDLDYLRQKHRHELHIRVELEVFGFDREIEFIALKDELYLFLQRVISGREPINVSDEHTEWARLHERIFCNEASCEEIAFVLRGHLRRTYGINRVGKVEVLEDGENGAVVTWTST